MILEMNQIRIISINEENWKLSLDIPISNKRKRGAPIKTKSALEFQPSVLVSNKEIGIESLEDDDEEDDVVETTSKRAIVEETNEIKSSSIQIKGIVPLGSSERRSAFFSASLLGIFCN
ncbi:hypothetical protein BpHYR1_040166 [Brachionus plicatilis]|uniref:Uncharacterized protein n=1 Tax=Brachionus plicatilis TaxID=10195 RepID=A0A3M7QQR9_BRAPC|nr:hypothetical protein BpHYR1_040166 [Brachionus plicatilis]